MILSSPSECPTTVPLAGPGAPASPDPEEIRLWLVGVLRARGAAPFEAEEIGADVIADAFVPRAEKLSLLQRIRPGSSPLPFLCRVAINRWIDRKRREKKQESLDDIAEKAPALALYHDLATDPGENAGEDAIRLLLRDAVARAFAECPRLEMVLLKLVLARKVPQENVARFLGISQSRISRQLSASLARLRSTIMDDIRRSDPWLVIHWNDILSTCRDAVTGRGDGPN